MLTLSRRLIVVSLSVALVVMSLTLQFGIFEEFPQFPYFDEVYTVAAAKVVATDPSSMGTDHPPLVPYLMHLSQRILGEDPAAWRLPARVFGSLSLAAVFLIGLTLTGSVIGPLFGAIALLCDGLFLTLTRTATWDTPYVCFGLWALLAALHAARHDRLIRRRGLYLASAILLGLSLSCKWAGLFFLGPIAVAAFLPSSSSRDALKRTLNVAALGIIALCVYITITCALRQLSIAELLNQTKNVFDFHISFSQPHRYVSPPWTWPLLIRPIWFGYEELPYLAADGSQAVRGMICLGNPAVFIMNGLSMVGLLGILVRDVFRRHINLCVVIPVIGYLSCWLPWMILTQRNGFLYYFYPSVTFACIGFGVATSLLWRRNRLFVPLCALALSLIVICGVVYLPVYFSVPTSLDHMDTLLFRAEWW